MEDLANASRIVSLGPAAAYDQLIGPELEAYCGQCFEGLCRQALPRLYRREPVHGSFEIGEYVCLEDLYPAVGTAL